MVEKVDLTLQAQLCQDTLAETGAIRRELADVQRLAVRTVELGEIERRNEARFAATETRFAEIDKRFTEIGKRFAVVDTRFAAIDTRFAAVDGRLLGIDQRIGGLTGELELTIKSELMSALGNFEARMIGLIERRLGG